MSVYEVATPLNLCNGTVFSHNLAIQIILSAKCYYGFRCSRGCHNISSPGSRLVISKKDCTVNLLSKCFNDSWSDLSPDIILRIIQDSFRDWNDYRNLFCSNEFLLPCHLCCLFLPSITINEICNRQHIKYRHFVLSGCHVWQPAPSLEHSGLGNNALYNLIGFLYRNQGLCTGTVNNVYISIKNV